MIRLPGKIKTYIIITLVASSCNNRNGQPASFIEQEPETACVPKNLYDSIYCNATRRIDSLFGANRAKEALAFMDKPFEQLKGADSLRRAYLDHIFGYRNQVEQDTAALQPFYDLLTLYYPEVFRQVYDPAYVDMAEYIIRLQKEKNLANPDYTVTFKNQLGISYNIAGDLKKATGYYREVYEFDLRDISNGNVGGSVQNICIALNQWGKHDSSLQLIRKTLALNLSNNSDITALYLLQCEAFLAKENIDAARAAANMAERRLSLIRFDSDDSARNAEKLAERSFELMRMRALIAHDRQNNTAYLFYAQQTANAALAMEGAYRTRTMGKSLLQLGSAFKKNNQPDSAMWCFHRALYTVAQVDSANILSLPEEKDIYAENTMMDALDSLAMMWDEQYTATKNTAFVKQALEARRLAFIVERKLREAFTYDESMKSQLLFSKKRSGYALNNCWLLWQKDNDAQWIAKAILMNENSKAVALLHSLKKNTALSKAQQQDSVATQLNKNRLYIIALEKQLNAANDLSQQQLLQKKLNDLHIENLFLDNILKQRLPGYKRIGLDAALLSTDSIEKKLLAGNACLLQYFRADSGAFIVWLDHTGVSGMKWLPGNGLQKVDDFIADCRSPKGLYEKNQPAFFSLAKACTDMALPGAVQQKIKNGGYKKLVVIPDGQFSILPFDALTPAGNKFLVQYSTVYTGYSISTLLANEPVKPGLNNISVFAPFTQTGTDTLQRLQFSQNEADAIAGAKKQTIVYADTNATINNFRKILGSSAIIHTATHAIGNDSLQQIFFRNGVLDVSELYATHTNAELVVLSGCQTGIGRLDPNEGPLSLARGFYYAGAQNVINSLWQIDDLSTADIFSHFYKTYSTGSGRAGKALHEAKLDYLENNSGKLLAPYFWAGLVHTGMDEEHTGTKKYGWLLPSIMITTILLIVLRIRHIRRRR